MTHRVWISLGLALMAIAGWSTAAGAEGYIPGGEAVVTVDALPLQAEVWLDGVVVGTAHDLLNRPLAVVPGHHLVQVSARGYLTTAVPVPSLSNWTSRVQVVLIPDRGR